MLDVTIDDLFVRGYERRLDGVRVHVWVRGFGSVVVNRGTPTEMLSQVRAYLAEFIPVREYIQ